MYYKLSEQELNSISIAMPGINTSHTENGPLCHETKIYPIKITAILLFCRAK